MCELTSEFPIGEFTGTLLETLLKGFCKMVDDSQSLKKFQLESLMVRV